MRVLSTIPWRMTVGEALAFSQQVEAELYWLNKSLETCPATLKPYLAQMVKDREEDLAAVNRVLDDAVIYPYYREPETEEDTDQAEEA